MALLSSLGVNGTLWLHAACFAVAYFCLAELVFKPYLRALQQRESKTTGNEEYAVKLLAQVTEINAELETKTKAVAQAIRSEFEKSRLVALKESEAAINAERLESSANLEESRKLLQAEIQKARAHLSKEIPAVTAAIASQLAGKEMAP